MEESIDVSSEGNSAGPVKEREDGGVRALWSGEALYDWLLCDMLEKGGMEERLIEEGDCGICCRVSGRKRMAFLISWKVSQASYLDPSLLL